MKSGKHLFVSLILAYILLFCGLTQGKCAGRWAIHACGGGNGKRSSFNKTAVGVINEKNLKAKLEDEPLVPVRNEISTMQIKDMEGNGKNRLNLGLVRQKLHDTLANQQNILLAKLFGDTLDGEAVRIPLGKLKSAEERSDLWNHGNEQSHIKTDIDSVYSQQKSAALPFDPV